MTDVLILGGTGWLSGRIAERWRDAGAAVTVLARGGRDAPAGTRLVVADRERDDAYTAVADREWDEVVDISSTADHVRAATAVLAERTRHWTYVSSVSAYATDDVAGADESAALAVAAEPGDPYDYRREKAAAEQAVTAALVRRAAVVRPGLIVGPGDPTDRFGYWVARLAAAAAEPVLIPDAPGARVQVIDVDDLADFVVEVGAARFTGAVNAVGDSLPLEGVIAAARAVAGHTGALVPASAPWLVAHGVGYWAGERSLPLWLPDDVPGFATRANGTYRILGGRHRPLEDVLRRVLADERERGLDRPRSAGLTRADERELLDALAQ
ncbi:NAD-dependent epimerase/dehydratase family protein [Microbacterium laevaniformans]|uniref:NAD-dependent epimerase/dehydratase family protein n=1 Tax=Microbacterium laevaniformans TaxID=36807 RepID=A0A4S2DB41_9MICO|nr:NAD-dependent epimerase/dehydratase family protein [Microbacterium laevaniformans]TGY39047.1 NAD-dependent epimerase/dehydratase family protein [Microbacterium laevaniformans]